MHAITLIGYQSLLSQQFVKWAYAWIPNTNKWKYIIMVMVSTRIFRTTNTLQSIVSLFDQAYNILIVVLRFCMDEFIHCLLIRVRLYWMQISMRWGSMNELCLGCLFVWMCRHMVKLSECYLGQIYEENSDMFNSHIDQKRRKIKRKAPKSFNEDNRQWKLQLNIVFAPSPGP